MSPAVRPCQEAFHRARLRPGLGALRQPMTELLTALQAFFGTRVTEMLQDDRPLWDVPAASWSPDYRDQAAKYLSTGKYLMEQDNRGNLRVCMRRDPDSLEHERTALTQSVFSALMQVPLPNLNPESLLHELGCPLGDESLMSSTTLLDAARALNRWVLVIIGPDAEQWWKTTSCDLPCSHRAAACFHCKEHSIYGACCHTYVP